MTPADFKKARETLGLTGHQFGILLGYEDSKNLRTQIHKMETGDRPIRGAQARLVTAYLEGYRPKDWPL